MSLHCQGPTILSLAVSLSLLPTALQLPPKGANWKQKSGYLAAFCVIGRLLIVCCHHKSIIRWLFSFFLLPHSGPDLKSRHKNKPQSQAELPPKEKYEDGYKTNQHLPWKTHRYLAFQHVLDPSCPVECVVFSPKLELAWLTVASWAS